MLSSLLAVLMMAVLVFGLPAPAAAGGGDGEAPAAGARDAKLETILKRIELHYQKTDSFSAKFSEEIAAAGGTRRLRQGMVYYRKPGKMRWEFSPPEPETIVSDGKELLTYQPDLNQVLKTSLERVFATSAPVAFLLGIGKIEKDFNASLPAAPPSDALVHVTLVPKKGADVIELGLERESYDPAMVKITDQLGNVTTLRFSDIRTNIALEDSLFTFKVPEGADIIEAPTPR